MKSLDYMNCTLLISSIRALTHQINKAQNIVDDETVDDETNEEISLYLQDLLQARSLLMQAYEDQRGPELTEAEKLIQYFSKQDRLLA